MQNIGAISLPDNNIFIWACVDDLLYDSEQAEYWAVSIGTLDWTTGLDYWTHL